MKRWILALAISMTACSSSADCPSDTVTCPSTQPTYSTDVAPLFEKYCATCHVAGGQESGLLLDSYGSISSRKGEVESEIAGCDMPPSDESQPSTSERQKMLEWLTCGAPNN